MKNSKKDVGFLNIFEKCFNSCKNQRNFQRFSEISKINLNRNFEIYLKIKKNILIRIWIEMDIISHD